MRQTEEIAKDKLLADREAEDVGGKMSKCGIQVVQEETFFVEPCRQARPAPNGPDGRELP